MKLRLILAAVMVAAPAYGAGTYISEMLVNPPGSDNTQEGVEIASTPNTSLAGHFLVIVEGDGSNAGIVDVVVDLSSFTTGSNGLLLIRDDASVLSPAPDAGTSVVVMDFVPDIENGSNTYILGTGTPPAQGLDIDIDNDGTFDGNPFVTFTVLDAVTILENDGAANVGYADDLGFETLGPYTGPLPDPHTPDAVTRVLDPNGMPFGWVAGDVLGTNPGGPYDYAIASGEAVDFAAYGITALTVGLGVANPVASFKGTPLQVSGVTGGTHALELRAGASLAGRQYYVLGSLTGTSPGLPISPNVSLPLNVDFYFTFLISNPNTIVQGSFGTLDANGDASATFFVPGNLNLPTAITVNHACLVLSPLNVPVFASNAVPVELTP